MTNGDISEHGRLLLQAFDALAARREVATVQAAAITARLTFMEAYALVNTLFTSGYLSHDLRVTDAGRKVAA